MTEITLEELKERLRERVRGYERSLEQLRAQANMVAGAMQEAQALLAELDGGGEGTEGTGTEQDEDDA